MKKVRSRAGKAGRPPGTLVRVGEELPGRTTLRLFTYSADQVSESSLNGIADLREPETESVVTWIDIDGLNSERLLAAIGERFGLHPLMLEDILNTDHRPKVEEYQDALFVVAKMLSLDQEN